MAQTVKNPPAIQFLGSIPGWQDPLEKEWLPAPVFLPGEFQRHRRLVGHTVRGSQRVGHDGGTDTFTSHVAGVLSALQLFNADLVLIRYELSPASYKFWP